MKRLSVSAVKSASRPGRFSDGDGLYLVVQPGGSKSWVCRVQKAGNRRDFGIGSAAKVSLGDARERAREIRSQVEMGLDPLFERRKAKGIPTFREATAKVLAAHRKTWKNEKHEAQWQQSLRDYPSLTGRRNRYLPFRRTRDKHPCRTGANESAFRFSRGETYAPCNKP